MGLLLVLVLACGKQRGFDSIREEAAELGNRHYQNQMGVIYQTGEEGETNYVKALKWYIAAATPTNHVIQEGETLVNILTQFRVSSWDLKKNEGNKSNPALLNEEKKVDLSTLKPGTKIVIPGSPQAMYNVGAIYEVRYKELGLKQEDALEKAVEWHANGAEAGFIRAQFAYGYAFEHGQGVEKDLKQAGIWYELSAKQGLAAAQERLGQLHVTGFGDINNRSLPEAYLWLSIAEKALKSEGKTPGKGLTKAINTCRSSLPADERVRTDRLIDDFKALEN
jgi:TPR repeat protein